MPKQATIQIRIDENLKKQADELFCALGITASDAVRMFVAQSVQERQLPFTPRLSVGKGGTKAFGKLRHYGKPELTGTERTEWMTKQEERDKRKPPLSEASDENGLVIVDETILLRYLLDDDPRRSAKARRIIGSGMARIYPESVIRVLQALEETYRVPRSLIGTVLTLLSDDVAIHDCAAVCLAGRLYTGNRLPFASCLTPARSALTGLRGETFTKNGG